MMDDQHRDGSLEPAVLERKLFGASQLQPYAFWNLRARDLEHLRRRVDTPHLRGRPISQPCGERSGAAADVEHAPSAQIALVHEQLVQLVENVRLDVAQLVVVRG